MFAAVFKVPAFHKGIHNTNSGLAAPPAASFPCLSSTAHFLFPQTPAPFHLRAFVHAVPFASLLHFLF